jgi:hypothetical protein
VAHGDNISVPDEDVGFAKGDTLVDDLGRPRDDEQRLAILLQLRMLVRLAGVLDGEGMEIELRLHPGQQVVVRFEQPDPDYVTRPFRPLAGVVDGDVRCHALAVGVDARGDDARCTSGIRDPG